jgi:hypothetical protein
VVQDPFFSVYNITAAIPFDVRIDQTQMQILQDSGFKPPSWIEFESQRQLYQNLFSASKNMHIQRVEASGYTISDIMMDIDIRNGFIWIPSLQMRVLDGNLGGGLMINLGQGQPENISYSIQAQASRINASALLAEGKGAEEAELNATLAFNGKGIDLAQGIDLDGYFYITQIGPKFASTLLKGMDPEGSDRSIRLTRRLLDMGWKPKLFSFELRHGYVYPALSLSQPWFSPIRLPGQLEYGRIPIAFFLENRIEFE